jgi:hypothetical protein
MKQLTLILNVLLMAVFGFASTVVISPLHNRAIEYPSEPFISQPLPPLSSLLLSHTWIAWAVPLVWAVFSIALIASRKVDCDISSLHTSATLLIGVVMFFLFAMAGIFPFVGIVAHLK